MPITPRVSRIKFEELFKDLVNDYRVHGKKSIDHLQRRIDLHLTPFFGASRVAAVTTADVRRFIVKRQEEGASNAEINRELAALKRPYNLALQAGKLAARPHIPMLQEHNVRKGFFEWEQFTAVRDRKPAYLQPVVGFAYVTGWRKSEILSLKWHQVDMKASDFLHKPLDVTLSFCWVS